MKKVFALLALLGVLAAAGLTAAQEGARPEGVSFIADAQAEIVQGNSAQARQDALSAALRAAVEQAALRLVGPQARPEAFTASLARPEAYILSYRILGEGRVEPEPPPEPAVPAQPAPAAPPAPSAPPTEAAQAPAPPPPPSLYAVRAEVLVAVDALKRDLRARGLIVPEEEPLPAVAAALEGSPPAGVSPERVQALMLAALQQAGFKARMASGQKAAGELAVAARLKLSCAAGAGCQAEASLVGSKAAGTGTATGQNAEEALAGALRLGASALARQLRQPVAVALRLLGVASYTELAQVEAALSEMDLPWRERSFAPGEIVLEVRAAGGSEGLARRLTGRAFEGFALSSPQPAPGVLSVTFSRPRPQP